MAIFDTNNPKHPRQFVNSGGNMPQPGTQTMTAEPQSLQDWVNQMLASGDPIKQAGGIQGQALGEAIPLFAPYQQAGLTGLEQFQQGSTPEGLDQILSQIMGGDSFQALQDRRGEEITNMLAAGGLTRSGETIQQGADLTIDNATDLYGLLNMNQRGLVDLGFNSTSQIGDLTTGVGEAIASGILGHEASKNARDAQKDTNRSNLFGSLIGAGGAIGAASIFGSDPALKTNIQKTGKQGPLNTYKWDWIPEAKGTIIESWPNQGFLSTEVREHFPDRVKTFGGFDVIDYGHLIEDLQCHL